MSRAGMGVIYDVTNPTAPTFITYENNRDFSVSNTDLRFGLARDLGPESIAVIAAKDIPNGRPLMVVANEVSGTVSIYAISKEKQKN